MRLNQLSDDAKSRRSSKRVGRGIGSGKGKTSGRGHKGQKSRSGGSLPAGFEGGQMPLYRRLPKRGFTNPFRKEFSIINVGAIQSAIDKGLISKTIPITTELLLKTGLAKKSRNGVRMLAKGNISESIEISVEAASKTAISAVEKAGGTVVLPTSKPLPPGKGKARHRISNERRAQLAEVLEKKD